MRGIAATNLRSVRALIQEAGGIILSAILLLLPSPAPAARAAVFVPPDVLANRVTQDVLAILKTDKAASRGDVREAAQIIEAQLLPYFDFVAMTRFAMGSNWRRATPEQRQALIGLFRSLLVHIYAASLAHYRGEVIKFEALRLPAGAADVEVKSQILGAGRAPISVVYSMEHTDSGWKVYDVEIDGVSLVETYRDQFSGSIEANGIDGLIAALRRKDRAFE